MTVEERVLAQTESVSPGPELEQVRRHLGKWWVDSTCPVCEHDDWGVDSVALVPAREGTEASLTGITRVYPVVPIICKTCGYTFFVNEKWVLDQHDSDKENADG